MDKYQDITKQTVEFKESISSIYTTNNSKNLQFNNFFDNPFMSNS